jgi:UDP-glucose 4-epimerase
MYHTVAITGSSGFIGKVLTDHFIQKDKCVRGIDTRDRVDLASNKFSLCRLDLLSQNTPTGVPNFSGTGALIHLAAISGVVQPQGKEQETIDYNVGLMDQAMLLCHDNMIPCMIHASSSAVYGDVPTPFVEDGPKNPLSAYGRSKLLAEELADNKARELGIRVFSFRLYNVVGRYQRPGSLLWNALEASVGLRPPLPLYGITFRAYTWVQDFARACFYIADNYRKWPPGHYVFNLGSEVSCSQLKVFSEIENYTSRVVPYVMVARRDVEMEVTLPDMTKTKRELGIQSTLNGLECGVKDAILWFKACHYSR